MTILDVSDLSDVRVVGSYNTTEETFYYGSCVCVYVRMCVRVNWMYRFEQYKSRCYLMHLRDGVVCMLVCYFMLSYVHTYAFTYTYTHTHTHTGTADIQDVLASPIHADIVYVAAGSRILGLNISDLVL
jgi:uncharacterized membrane protein